MMTSHCVTDGQSSCRICTYLIYFYHQSIKYLRTIYIPQTSKAPSLELQSGIVDTQMPLLTITIDHFTLVSQPIDEMGRQWLISIQLITMTSQHQTMLEAFLHQNVVFLLWSWPLDHTAPPHFDVQCRWDRQQWGSSGPLISNDTISFRQNK